MKKLVISLAVAMPVLVAAGQAFALRCGTSGC
jgi:hypothetical protein